MRDAYMDGILFMLAEAECTMDTAVQLTGRGCQLHNFAKLRDLCREVSF